MYISAVRTKHMSVDIFVFTKLVRFLQKNCKVYSEFLGFLKWRSVEPAATGPIFYQTNIITIYF